MSSPNAYDFYPFDDRHVVNTNTCENVSTDREQANLSMNSDTDPKKIVNSRLLKIKEEMTSVADDDDSAYDTQIPNQQFYMKLDHALRNLPKDLYIDELLSLCHNEAPRINWYRATLAERARANDDCPASRLVTRRKSKNGTIAEKCALDCYVIHMFNNGERTSEIYSVFSSADKSIMDTTQVPPSSPPSCEPTLKDTLDVADISAVIMQIQSDVKDLLSQRKSDYAVFREMKHQCNTFSDMINMTCQSVNSLRACIQDTQDVNSKLNELTDAVLKLNSKVESLSEQFSCMPLDGDNNAINLQYACEPANVLDNTDGSPLVAKLYADVLQEHSQSNPLQRNTGIELNGTPEKSSLCNSSTLSATPLRTAPNRSTDTVISKPTPTSTPSRVKDNTISRPMTQCNTPGTNSTQCTNNVTSTITGRSTSSASSTSNENKSKAPSTINVINTSSSTNTRVAASNSKAPSTSNAPTTIIETSTSNAPSTSHPTRAGNINGTGNARHTSTFNAVSQTSSIPGRSNDTAPSSERFVAVRRKKLITFHVGNIDPDVTKDDFEDFLRTKDIVARKLQMFYNKTSVSAKLIVYLDCAEIIESEGFWPHEIVARRWKNRSEWEKELEERRDVRRRQRNSDGEYSNRYGSNRTGNNRYWGYYDNVQTNTQYSTNTYNEDRSRHDKRGRNDGNDVSKRNTERSTWYDGVLDESDW